MSYPQQQGGAWVNGTTPEERNWALGAHIGSIVTAWFAFGLIAPLIVLLAKGNDSPFIRRHAVESLNFQINALVWTVVFGLSLFVLIGFLLLPLYGVFYLVCVVMATIKASRGRGVPLPADAAPDHLTAR